MTNEMSLAVFDPPKAMVADLVKKDASQEFDHTTPEGETALRSWVRRVRGGKGDLEKVRVAAKANALAFGKKVDALAKDLKAPLEKIISERMKPLDDIEDAKRVKAEKIVEAERVAAEKVEADKLADLKRREAEVARKEAEIKVAEEAANAEQQAADSIERERRLVAVAVERGRQDAIGEAAEKEQARLDEIEDKAAVERMDAEVERRRVANEDHRVQIEREVEQSVWIVLDRIRPKTICETSNAYLSTGLVEDIIAGKIPHLTIKY